MDPSEDDLHRQGPTGSLRKQFEDAELLATPLARQLLEMLGLPPDAFQPLIDIAQTTKALAASPAAWRARLPALGWAVYSGCPVDLYDQASKLANDGHDEEANELLVEGWNSPDRLKHQVLRVISLGVGEDRRAVANRRHELLLLALEDHKMGRFHASIPLLLSQMEGIVQDVAARSPFNQVSLGDTITLAGHPESLPLLLQQFFNRWVSRTSLALTDEVPSRHGVLHGRSLRYDTRANSTKTFVALFATIEVARAEVVRQYDAGTLAPLDVDL